MDKKELQECWSETYSAFNPFLMKMENDFKVTLGDQWSEADKKIVTERGQVPLNINIMKLVIDMLSGYQRQNRTDIKAFPIEGGDEHVADVYSKLIKFVIDYRNGANNISMAFDDTVIGGLGWIHPVIDYDHDFINGDITIKRDSPFRIMIDPYTTNPDLSNCDYILRHGLFSKSKLIRNYPKHKKDIKNLSKGAGRMFPYQTMSLNDRGERLNVVEAWYWESAQRIILYDVQTTQSRIWEKGEKELAQAQEARPDLFEQIMVIKRDVPILKMLSVCEEELVLYDGVSPYGVNMYPFIPIFGYFFPSYADWSWKLQGVSRPLIDAQLEKNKRRSQMMYAALSMPTGGWKVEENSVDNMDVFKKAAGSSRVIEYRKGATPPAEIDPFMLPPALVQLEQLHTEDIKSISAMENLGFSFQKGESGVAMRTKIRQGLTSYQNIFDNFSLSMRLLGNYIMALADKNYTEEKVARITGGRIPPESDFIYDCKVDEIASSPTYRMANFIQLSQLAEHGYPVPPSVLMSLADLPPEVKALWEQEITKLQGAQDGREPRK